MIKPTKDAPLQRNIFTLFVLFAILFVSFSSGFIPVVLAYGSNPEMVNNTTLTLVGALVALLAAGGVVFALSRRNKK